MCSSTEINIEVAALKALIPVGPWAVKTKQLIQFAIEELTDGVDKTADEFFELTPGHQEHIHMVWEWKTGQSDEKPSVGWGSLVART